MCDTENKSPYTHEEKVFVASLVEQQKDCLESKKTDASSLQAKARAWEEITNNFKHRTSKQLRKLWDNLKHRGKNAIKNSINEEVQLMLRRLREGIEQQTELHRMKMAVAEAEKKYWEERKKLL